MSNLSPEAPWRDVVWPDQRFHRAIIEATESPRLIRAYNDLQSEITLCLAQLRPAYDAPAEVAAEHEELLGPIISGDVDQAEKLFRLHLLEATGKLIQLHSLRSEEAQEET
jgi:DNA-binding GntR family transcriptional regulator